MNARIKLVSALATLGLLAHTVISRAPLHTLHSRSAEAQEATDTRERIRLAPAERDAVLAEMRTMLQSLSRIVHGLVAGDLVMVENAARASGMRATVDPRFEKKLPPHFLQLGLRVHTRFDQLADAIKTGATKDDVLKRLAALTGYCVACHAAYRLEETR
jgi:cytochrome c556